MLFDSGRHFDGVRSVEFYETDLDINCNERIEKASDAKRHLFFSCFRQEAWAYNEQPPDEIGQEARVCEFR